MKKIITISIILLTLLIGGVTITRAEEITIDTISIEQIQDVFPFANKVTLDNISGTNNMEADADSELIAEITAQKLEGISLNKEYKLTKKSSILSTKYILEDA